MGRGFTYIYKSNISAWITKKINSADYLVLINNILGYLRYFVCRKEQHVAHVHKIARKFLRDYPRDFPFRKAATTDTNNQWYIQWSKDNLTKTSFLKIFTPLITDNVKSSGNRLEATV